MPFKHLVDEVRGSGILTGGVVALFASVLKVNVGIWVYALCIVLPLMGICGGAYFDRNNKAMSRPFLIWSVSMLLCAVALIALVSYHTLAVFGPVISFWITTSTWGVILSGLIWLFFVYRVERKPRHVNTEAIASAGVIGAVAGGVAFLISKDIFMSILGFLVMTIIGATLVGLLMSHLRDFIEFRKIE